MRTEKAQAEFEKLINKYSFTIAAHTIDSGIPVYHRVWNRENETLEIRILLSGEYPLMTVRRNGAPDPKLPKSQKRIRYNTQNHNSSRFQNIRGNEYVERGQHQNP